ncbi:MAG TPA: phosphoribosylglycinamide synthetase C domain-containing protein, partial [Syntrophales bacterium]|nr:phosphoribosylglycinamide synthetase C domain-containing protein [Syntrophales bacterium]
ADHPDARSTAAKIDVGDVKGARLYYASVDRRPDGLYMSTSRAIGVVGISETLEKAENMAEEAVSAIGGPVDHRPDIGTKPLLEKRVRHMEKIRSGA